MKNRLAKSNIAIIDNKKYISLSLKRYVKISVNTLGGNAKQLTLILYNCLSILLGFLMRKKATNG